MIGGVSASNGRYILDLRRTESKVLYTTSLQLLMTINCCCGIIIRVKVLQ